REELRPALPRAALPSGVSRRHRRDRALGDVAGQAPDAAAAARPLGPALRRPAPLEHRPAPAQAARRAHSSAPSLLRSASPQDRRRGARSLRVPRPGATRAARDVRVGSDLEGELRRPPARRARAALHRSKVARHLGSGAVLPDPVRTSKRYAIWGALAFSL